MGIRLVSVRHAVVFVVFLNTATAAAHLWIDSGESLNKRETRSLHDTSVDSSEPKSLAFIFDVTGSMSDDWKGAISGGKRILSEFLSYKTRPVKNFILVPFNDPAVGPVTNTENSDKFLEELNKLSINGGGDCPEMSVTGIIKGLEAAYPNSYLYVFTDASAKDYGRLDEALKLIQRKHSQVIFFITGDCDGTDKENFRVYEKIAGASYGQMYYLLKKNVIDVLKSVLITTQPNKSNLLVVSNPVLDPHNSVHYNLSVEKDLKELIVEVAGASPDVDIRNPLGKKPDKISIPFDLPNNKFIVIDHPEPAGNWVLKVTFHPEKPQKYKIDKPIITVKGVGSSYEIKHGFSIIPVDTLSGTAYRPLERRENYIYMEVHPTENTKENKDKLAKYKWENVDFMKSNGKPYFTLPLKPKTSGGGANIFPMRFLAGPFTPPDSPFSLSFRGLDENGNPVTRLSSNEISAEQANVPFVKMTSPDVFAIGKELKITCEVESLIPFSLQWYKEGKPIGAKKEFPQSSGDSFIVANAKKGDGGQYKCEATNARGLDNKNIVVTGLALPEIKGMDEGRLVVAEGGSVTLKCAVVSDSPHDVKWLHKKSGTVEGTLLSSSATVSIQKDSLSIPSLKPSEVGKYVCRASNKAGIVEKEVEIVMVTPPIVEIPIGDLFLFTKGETIVIDCKVTTSAKTTVHWEFKGAEVGLRRDIYKNDTITFAIPAADKTLEGVYSCIAENEAGKEQKQVESIYVELPSAKAVSPYVAVKLNQDATLQCLVSGIPPPVVSWVFGEKLLANGPKYQISSSSDGSSLKIIKSSLDDEGTYKCVAHGPRDSNSTAEIKFRIGRPPTAKRLYLNESVELEHDGTYPCESESNPEDALYPGMKTRISWQRDNGTLDDKRHQVLASGELKIKAAGVTDKGLFICTLQNDFGKVYMKLNLEVKGIVPPIMDKVKPENIHFKLGDNIVLKCNATGAPKPKIIWSYRKDDTAIPEELPDNLVDESIAINGGELKLFNSIKAYEGIVSCVADNGAGTTPPKDYTLKMIGGPPVIIGDGKPIKVIVSAGDDYTFDCSTNSTEDVRYRWIKDEKIHIDRNFPGKFTLSEDNARLTLHSTIPRYHDGIYKCNASNKVGTATKKFSIYVGKPIRNRII